MAKHADSTIFTIIFDKGKAARHRLPMSHVIATLRELDYMIRDVGTRIQRARGVENPNGDFGIELLTGKSGIAFLKGSVKANATPTRDVDNAIETIHRVIQTTNLIEKKSAISVDEFGAPILRHFATIIKFQEKDQTELRLELRSPGQRLQRGVFTESGIQTVRKLSGADFHIENLTVYGKLKGLTDRSRVEEDDDIWGELIEDNGHTWRIKFKPTDIEDAKKLFTRQVAVTGNAEYFKTNTPRIDVRDIRPDFPRDYVKAFDRLSSSYEEVFGDEEPEQIISDIRG